MEESMKETENKSPLESTASNSQSEKAANLLRAATVAALPNSGFQLSKSVCNKINQFVWH